MIAPRDIIVVMDTTSDAGLVAREKALEKKAGAILEDLGLIDLLKKCGEVKFVGGLALGLLCKKDIDIVVKNSPDYEKYLTVANNLFKQPKVYSLNLQDFRKSIHLERPQGIYCGISYLEDKERQEFWKIDIWFMEHSGAEELVDWVNSKMKDEDRLTILRIKNDMVEKTEHGKDISGMDVYKGVLEAGVKDLEGFREYLKKQGREL